MQQSVAEAELDRLATLCAALHLQGDNVDIAADLLEPIASALGAEAAVYRQLRLQPVRLHDAARPPIVNLASIGVSRSVSDAYLAHYHRFDPFLHRLPLRSAETPSIADDARKAPDPEAAAADSLPARDSFRLYCHAFLYPNGLVRHTGFLVADAQRRHAWVFNFHRPASAPDFSALELARSRLIAACLQGQAGAPESAAPSPCRQNTDRLPALTTREHEVVSAVAQGLANKQIADSLGISPRTVENHLRNIYGKLQINTRTRLLSMLRAP